MVEAANWKRAENGKWKGGGNGKCGSSGQDCVDWASNWISGRGAQRIRGQESGLGIQGSIQGQRRRSRREVALPPSCSWRPEGRTQKAGHGAPAHSIRFRPNDDGNGRLATGNCRQRPCKSGTNEHIDKLSFLHASPAELASSAHCSAPVSRLSASHT